MIRGKGILIIPNEADHTWQTCHAAHFFFSSAVQITFERISTIAPRVRMTCFCQDQAAISGTVPPVDGVTPETKVRDWAEWLAGSPEVIMWLGSQRVIGLPGTVITQLLRNHGSLSLERSRCTRKVRPVLARNDQPTNAWSLRACLTSCRTWVCTICISMHRWGVSQPTSSERPRMPAKWALGTTTNSAPGLQLARAVIFCVNLFQWQ